MRDFLSVMES